MKEIIKKVGLVIFGVFIIAIVLLNASGGNLGMALLLVDTPSLVIVVFPVIFILIFAGLWGDYTRAYKFAMGNKEYTTKELKASVLALDLSIKITAITGGIGTVIGVMFSLANLTDLSYLGVYLTVIIITVLYALVFNLIQMPIRTNIQKELIYREN